MYLLDTYKNLAKYSQRVTVEVYINWDYLRQDAGKLIQKNQIWDHTGELFKGNHLQTYRKQYWRLTGCKRIIREDHAKEKYLTTNQTLLRRDWKILSKKRVRVKAGIPPSISKKAVRRVLWWLNNLKWTHFWRKGILTKNDLKLRKSLL